MKSYIAAPGYGDFRHRFGGSSWQAVDPQPVAGGPALLLVLDLCDPRFVQLGITKTTELPLASYINSSIWTGEQIYQVAPETRRIGLESRSVTVPEILEPEDRLPHPLPERQVVLRMMRREEDPDAVGRLAASDTFLGGEAFIRVMGSPLWLLDPMEVRCTCLAPMKYVASIGYEVNHRSMLDKPFFIGEGALYFFVCRACLKTAVRSQPS